MNVNTRIRIPEIWSEQHGLVAVLHLGLHGSVMIDELSELFATAPQLRTELAALQGRYGAFVNRLWTALTGCSVGEYDNADEWEAKIMAEIAELRGGHR